MRAPFVILWHNSPSRAYISHFNPDRLFYRLRHWPYWLYRLSTWRHGSAQWWRVQVYW